MKRKRIGITLGDAAGIGPEIIVAAWEELVTSVSAAGEKTSHAQNRAACDFFVWGHPGILRRAAHLRGVKIEVQEIDATLVNPVFSPQVIPCVKCCRDDLLEVPVATIDSRTGRGAFDALTAAIRAAQSGILDAIVTAPLHKEALHLAGLNYPGHTEILAERCGVIDYAMLLYSAATPRGLAIVHVTLHQSMRTIFAQITPEAILAKAHLVNNFWHKLNGVPAKIAVCALNPHAGEHGIFGNEEIEIIAPAIARGAAEGLDIHGPFPADTLMVAAQRGDYEAVVAMYHDQGHIALKILGMHRAVNVTLGLPIIRTSVAHGTAFDIAGRGIANPQSLIEAAHLAARLA